MDEHSRDLELSLIPARTPDPAKREEAFEAWLAANHDAITNRIKRYNNFSCDTIQDIYQDICITLHAKLESGTYEYREIPLLHYAYRICANVVNKYKVQRAKQSQLEDVSGEHLPLTSTVRRPVEEAVIARLAIEDLEQRIAKLPDVERQVITNYLSGYRPTEIAAMLGSTRNAVDQAKSRAIRKLRRVA